GSSGADMVRMGCTARAARPGRTGTGRCGACRRRALPPLLPMAVLRAMGEAATPRPRARRADRGRRADLRRLPQCRGVGASRAALFKAIAAALGPLPIIAEDLGIVTPDVGVLRRRFAFPGMRVLQFAFAEGSRNPYLPHHHEPDSVVYTGTHDNDTTLGWWAA